MYDHNRSTKTNLNFLLLHHHVAKLNYKIILINIITLMHARRQFQIIHKLATFRHINIWAIKSCETRQITVIIPPLKIKRCRCAFKAEFFLIFFLFNFITYIGRSYKRENVGLRSLIVNIPRADDPPTRSNDLKIEGTMP